MATSDVARIGSNIGAMFALNSLQSINNKLTVHQQRLATGKRINSAADDPAGLSIASKLLARSEGLKVANDNIGDARNMMSVAEAGLSKMNDILITMRSKAEQAASDTLGVTERKAIESQLSAYAEQIDDIVKETKWNDVKLLDGTVNMRFQTGVDDGEFTQWQLSQKHDATALNLATMASGTNQVETVSAVTGTGISTVAQSALATGATELSSGNYQVEVLAVDTANTRNTAISTAMAGVTLGTGTATDTLASGTYQLKATTAATAANGTLQLMDATGTTALATVTFGAVSGGNAAFTVGGQTMTLSVTTGSLVNGATMSFEHVKKGDVKYEVNDASGSAVSIGGKAYAYSAGTTGDTGRGASITFSNATVAAGDVSSFVFHATGDYLVNVDTSESASTYMTKVNSAIDTVNQSMASLGSLMARLDFKSEQVSAAQINVEASWNRIMNANMAEEQVNASKFQILQQTATAMLAQANSAPQFLLSLFR